MVPVRRELSRTRMTSPPMLLGRKLLKNWATRYDEVSRLNGDGVPLGVEEQAPAPGGEGEHGRVEQYGESHQQEIAGAHPVEQGGEVRRGEQVGEKGQAHRDLERQDESALHLRWRISMASMSAPSVTVSPGQW